MEIEILTELKVTTTPKRMAVHILTQEEARFLLCQGCCHIPARDARQGLAADIILYISISFRISIILNRAPFFF